MKHFASASGLGRWLLIAGFAVLIFGSKLWLIDRAGSDLPVLDQWDAEAEVIFRPWLEGWIGLREFVHPHNEHRPITTKLHVLGLLAANGQWSNLVEVCASAAIHTLIALLLLLVARRWLQGIWEIAAGLLLILLFALPFAWENTLIGFQVQFYFLLLFSLGHLVLTFASDRFSWRWAAGQVCAILALASMASGFLSAAAVLVVLVLQARRVPRFTTQQVVTVILSALLIAVGWAWRFDAPIHSALRAQNPADAAWALLQLLGWPGPGWLPWVVAPPVLFLVRSLRTGRTASWDPRLVSLWCWLFLQCVSVAVGRGAGEVLASRYYDLLALNVLLGFLFLVQMLSGRTRAILAALWLGAVAGGLILVSRQEWRDFVAPRAAMLSQQADRVRAYLKSGDSSVLQNRTWPEIPYPVATVLQDRLDRPALQKILPPSVRRPVALRPTPDSEIGSVPPALLPTSFSIAFSTQSPNGANAVHWRSVDQPATTLPLLRFRIAGDLGGAGRQLQLTVNSATGEVAVVPDSVPGERWKNVTIARPAGTWWVEARDNDPNGWFAFTEPVELTRGTQIAEKLVKFHFVVLLIAVALLLTGGMAAWRGSIASARKSEPGGKSLRTGFAFR